MRIAAGKVTIVTRVAVTMSAVVTLVEALAAEIVKTATTASAAATLAGALVVETAKVTASERAIVTVVNSLREVTLAIGQTRVVLSVGVARVTAVVTKTVVNVMTHAMMMRSIMQKKSQTTVSCAPLAKVVMTPDGLTRAMIGSVGTIGMTRQTQGRTQCCPQLRNQWE